MLPLTGMLRKPAIKLMPIADKKTFEEFSLLMFLPMAKVVTTAMARITLLNAQTDGDITEDLVKVIYENNVTPMPILLRLLEATPRLRLDIFSLIL